VCNRFVEVVLVFRIAFQDHEMLVVIDNAPAESIEVIEATDWGGVLSANGAPMPSADQMRAQDKYIKWLESARFPNSTGETNRWNPETLSCCNSED